MELVIAIFIQPFIDMADDPVLFIQVIWEGLVTGILYSLIAFGFVLIFKASGVFNFAQGIMVVFAALTLVGLNENGVPAFFALPITILVMYILAFSVERFVLRSLVNQPVDLPGILIQTSQPKRPKCTLLKWLSVKQKKQELHFHLILLK